MPRHSRDTERGSRVSLLKGRRADAWRALLTEKELCPSASLRQLARDAGLDRASASKRWRAYEAARAGGSSKADALECSCADKRGGHNRAFAPEHEALLAGIVREAQPSLTHSAIQAEAQRLHAAVLTATHRTHATRSAPPPFHASDHFVAGFKRRQRLSSHRTALKHVSRAERGRDVELEKLAFVVEARECVQLYGASLVLNMDETPVQLLDAPVTAVVSTGSKQAAAVHSTAGSLGTKITTFPCISAAGDKLPLCAILRGKTERCLASVRQDASDAVQAVRLYHSDKGWINESIMLRWLADVVAPYTRSHPAALLLDSYRAHFTDAVRAAAAAMQLRLIQVPAGTTAELQPLDVGFNGPMLMKRKQLWAQLKLAMPFAEDTRQRAIERAQLAYAAQPKATAERAFREAFIID